MVRTFKYSVFASMHDGVRGLFLWTPREIRFYPTVQYGENWEAHQPNGDVNSFVEYAWETQLGGYNTFSKPKTVQCSTLTRAAEMIADQLGEQLAPSAFDHWAREDDLRREADSHRLYQHLLTVASEFLLRVNDTEDPGAYCDVRPPRSWGDRSLTLFTQPNSHSPTVSFYVEEFEDLLMIQHPDCDPDSVQSWLTSNLGAIGRGSVENDVQELSRIAELELSSPSDRCPRHRFGIWARLFRACVSLRDDLDMSLSEDGPWSISTSFHSGWGTYYVHFHRWDESTPLSISEEGHFASLAPPFESTGTFNLRRAVQELSLEDATRELIAQVRRMNWDAPN